jgi:signal transduction histidine kinase
MNESSRENTALGRLTRPASRSLAAITVDCKTWDTEVPADRWSTGKLASVPRGAHAGAQGAFTPAESLDLEIALRISPGAKAAEAFAIATQLFAAVLAHDLGHGLTYDRGRSGVAEDRVVIVLTPGQSDPNVEARLEKLAEAIRSAMSEAAGIALSKVRVRRAA